ncbi:MAG TPA: transcription antitermination factor NusB [Planctomycetota bacterium]
MSRAPQQRRGPQPQSQQKPKIQTGVAPRKLVLKLLLETRGFPTRRFAAAADHTQLDPRDRALARELLGGVLRRKRTLDAIARPFCKRTRLEPAVRWTIRLALYQRFYLEQVPTYAAFGATLDAGRYHLGRALGFANAVLRAADRAATDENPASAEPAADRLSVEDAAFGLRSWRFDEPIFPDPAAEPVSWHALAYSYPDLLVQRWIDAVGVEKAVRRMQLGNLAPTAAIRVNPARADRNRVVERLTEAGLRVVKPGQSEDGCPIPINAYLLPDGMGDPRGLPGFADGGWSVQDLSSQQVLAFARPRAGERVLDLCAAPGGKSFAALETTGSKIELVACDVDAARLAAMEADAKRLGHKVRTRLVSGAREDLPGSRYDLLILDLPCSNTGVLGRRAEARWRFDAESLQHAIDTQAGIADTALSRLLVPGGRALWSTCSLEPEEDLVGATAAAERAGLEVVDSHLFEPEPGRAGAFAAILRQP